MYVRFLKIFDIDINHKHIVQRKYLLNHTRGNRLCLCARVLFDIRRGKLDIFHPLYLKKKESEIVYSLCVYMIKLYIYSFLRFECIKHDFSHVYNNLYIFNQNVYKSLSNLQTIKLPFHKFYYVKSRYEAR